MNINKERGYSSRLTRTSRNQHRAETNRDYPESSSVSAKTQTNQRLPSGYQPMQCLPIGNFFSNRSNRSRLDQNHSRSSSSRGIQANSGSSSSESSVCIVDGTDQSCCVVDAIAGVTGGDYARARAAAIEHGFIPGEGMSFRSARDALDDLGARATYYYLQPDKWDKFPNKAIVSVTGDTGKAHAVILKGDYIYDSNRSEKIHRDNYQIRPNNSFIELRKDDESDSSS